MDAKTTVLSVDVANCLPEDGPDGDKFNLGAITIGLRQATPPGVDPATNANPIVPIGTIENDQPTYVARGGLYDIPLGPLDKKTRALLSNDAYEMVLQSQLAGVLLSETPYMVASDQGCAYLDELAPGQQWQTRTSVRRSRRRPIRPSAARVDLFLRYRGRVPKGRIAVRVEQWKRLRPASSISTVSIATRCSSPRRACRSLGGQGRYRLAPAENSGLRLYRLVPPDNFPQAIAPDTLANTWRSRRSSSSCECCRSTTTRRSRPADCDVRSDTTKRSSGTTTSSCRR
jgi:hypothetical protein